MENFSKVFFLNFILHKPSKIRVLQIFCVLQIDKQVAGLSSVLKGLLLKIPSKMLS